MNLFVTKKKGAALVCAAACAALMMGSLVGCEAAAAPPNQTIQPAASQSAPSEFPEEVGGSAIGTSSSTPPDEEGASEDAWTWPVEDAYFLSALYGERTHPVTGETTSHSGVDIPADSGTGVMAAVDGVVLAAEFDKLYGNYVVLDHGNGLTSLYGHMSKLLVAEGDGVEAGQTIGAVGATGQATGAHLHFEVQQDGEPTHPLAFYPGMSFEVLNEENLKYHYFVF